MARLKDSDALIQRIDKSAGVVGIGLEPVMAIRDIKALILAMPTVDAEPVRRGRWVDDNCSICGVYVHHGDCRIYCPNCGAKMDGGDNDAAD